MVNKVIIAEDHAAVRRLHERILRRPDVVVESVGNTSDLIARVLSHRGRLASSSEAAAQNPDLVRLAVVSDHNMPGELTGLTALTYLLQDSEFKGMYAILVTGTPYLEAEAAQAGISHLQKPFSPQQLYGMISNYFGLNQ